MPETQPIATLDLPDAAATAALGARIAPSLAPGDVVLLAGPLGAGKTALARAIIQARLAAHGLCEEVPSPSFTLVQVYEAGGTEIWHVDLYRIGDAAEVVELGLADAFETAICLVEWPDRLGAETPARHLLIALEDAGEGRRARVLAYGGGWSGVAARLAGWTP
ncbi:MAG: tRNA (adenosine(37)-N6)-threonylcarbamoyltransferase complex ATPase subunit type 1 TsaE [Alphaproteobacteria bacterium]|nr:MAG: tRNA (adenosine(37)-N6)-threonylcarbamoyltransferase complex ATPase subunit type 1 TsaE [Alphaproteobacteria bacterium]